MRGKERGPRGTPPLLLVHVGTTSSLHLSACAARCRCHCLLPLLSRKLAHPPPYPMMQSTGCQGVYSKVRFPSRVRSCSSAPARWRSLYFMAPSKWGWLTRQRSILWATHRMPRMPEGEGGEARGRLSCSRVISLWWLKDPMVLSHSRSETGERIFGGCSHHCRAHCINK